MGKYIVHKIGKEKIIGKIVETEAYVGAYDKASHAYGYKRTEKNRAEYLIGGHVYIYLVYGMYWQLNISTGEKNMPECVLIRALEPITLQADSYKLQANIANGPGKLCNFLKLNKQHYGIDVCASKELWLEEGEKIMSEDIMIHQRIGIDYAKEWAQKPWRFYLNHNALVSKI